MVLHGAQRNSTQRTQRTQRRQEEIVAREEEAAATMQAK
jgi:hypothetical protein